MSLRKRARGMVQEIVLTLGVLALGGSLIWFGSLQGWWGPQPGIMPGEQAAGFALEDLDGQSVALQDVVGERPVLLNFWATWCEPCLFEMPALQRLHDEGKAVVVGVNFNEPRERARLYLAALEVSYPILFDNGGQVTSELYRVADLPATIVINEQGTICARVRGAPVEPYEHFADLLARLEGGCPVALEARAPAGA